MYMHHKLTATPNRHPGESRDLMRREIPASAGVTESRKYRIRLQPQSLAHTAVLHATHLPHFGMPSTPPVPTRPTVSMENSPHGSVSTTAPAQQNRLEGLDLFRGLAVAGMIIVNSPGSEQVWWPLDHAAWHGFTPTDLVFPAFLFAVGAALGLSFPRAIDATTWARILRRTLLLIALGWMIQLLARLTFVDFRIFGVLPRIGLCYAAAASLAILTARTEGRAHLNPKTILTAAIAALAIYAALLLWVPVPGHGAGQLSPEGNIAGYVDRTLFTTAHIWRHGTDAAGNIVYDPEGLLSTLPALANVLSGILAAIAWKRAPDRAVRQLLIAGTALTLIGLALTPVLPLNKRIWTPSFALFTTGLSAILLALAMLATARQSLRKALTPLHIFGTNAITGYILSLLLIIAALKPILPGGGTIQAWTFARINIVVPDPYLASFLFAVLVLLIVFATLVPMHRRGIHLRL